MRGHVGGVSQNSGVVMVELRFTDTEYGDLINHLTVIRCKAQMCHLPCGHELYVKTAEMEYLFNTGVDRAKEEA